MNINASIIMIEDEKNICSFIENVLTPQHYQIATAGTGTEGLKLITALNPDLVLLDVQLGSVNGITLCARIRETSEVPVIFLTGRSSAMDELECLTRGGDDFIAKPYQAPVLLAHIRAVLRRSKPKKQEKEQLCCQGVRLFVPEACLEYRGQRVDLTRNELKILYYLFRHPGEIVSRGDLTEYLWDQDVFIDDNALSVHMTRIRNKLSALGVDHMIKTKRGMGYQV